MLKLPVFFYVYIDIAWNSIGNMRKLANIVRRVFRNSVQASYFERFHWSILNFWTLQTMEHAVPCSVAVMLSRFVVSKNSKLANENVQNN